MTQSGFKKLSLVAGLSILLSACVTQPVEKYSTPHNEYQLTGTQQLNNRQRADLLEAIITADIAEHKKDYQTATSYYLFAAEISQDQDLINKSIQSSELASDPLGLEQAARIWLQIEPKNIKASSLLLKAQLKQQDNAQALKTAEMLFNQIPSSNIRYQILMKNVLVQQPRDAFNFLKTLSEKFPDEVAITTAQARFIFNLAGQNDKEQDSMYFQALNTAEQALTQDPAFVPAIRTKTHLLFRLHKDNEARNFLNDKLAAHPDSVEINRLQGQLLYDLRDFKACATHNKQWLQTHPDDIVSQYYLAASLYALGNFKQSYQNFYDLLDKNYKTDIVAYYCGDSAFKTGQTEESLHCFARVEKGRFFTSAKIQQANILAKKGQVDKALSLLKQDYAIPQNQKTNLTLAEIDIIHKKMSRKQATTRLEEAIKDSPDNLAFLLKKIEIYQLAKKPLALVNLLKKAQSLLKPGKKLDKFNLAAAALIHNNGHIQQSIDWINDALTEKPKDKELLYARVMYKESLGLHNEMVKELKYLNKLYPDDVNIQNALGYTLADHNIELDFAEILINKAYKKHPESSAITDSRGWLAYRQGKLAEATNYLTKAFKISPSAEISAHLGEVLWKQGKQQDARSVWQRGLKIDKTNKILLKTLKRFKIKH